MGRYAEYETELYRAGAQGELSGFPFAWERLELLARRALPPASFAYVAGSAGTEATARANRRAFQTWEIVPRQLRGVPERHLETELLGLTLPTPVLLAPIGALGTLSPQAELKTARVAAELGVPLILSCLACADLEAVAEALAEPGSGGLAGVGWFQLYWPKDRDLALSLVRRAERASYRALVLTVDTWALAWRPRDLENGYLPFLQGQGLVNYLSDPVFRASLSRPPEADPGAAVRRWSEIFGNPELRWEDVAWLAAQTRLPLVVKGICHPEDASAAWGAGAAAVVVSNHGGRQVDGARAALECLPGVVEVSKGRPVLFDSGIRGGADVFKALALGARAVLLGRPYAFALAAGGPEGLRHTLRCLLAELDLTLGLSGHSRSADLTPEALVRRGA
ncbi:MAG: alpha-hydroxy-acid oxidizing protein [Candidatus Dormibacteria bacterium]